MSILIKYCEGRMFWLWVGDDFLIFLKASHFVIIIKDKVNATKTNIARTNVTWSNIARTNVTWSNIARANVGRTNNT